MTTNTNRGGRPRLLQSLGFTGQDKTDLIRLLADQIPVPALLEDEPTADQIRTEILDAIAAEPGSAAGVQRRVFGNPLARKFAEAIFPANLCAKCSGEGCEDCLETGGSENSNSADIPLVQLALGVSRLMLGRSDHRPRYRSQGYATRDGSKGAAATKVREVVARIEELVEGWADSGWLDISKVPEDELTEFDAVLARLRAVVARTVGTATAAVALRSESEISKSQEALLVILRGDGTTLPNMPGVEVAPARVRKVQQELMRAIVANGGDWNDVREFVDNRGGRDYKLVQGEILRLQRRLYG